MTAHLSEALPRFATPEEASALLRRHVMTIRKQLRRGSLPGIKISGRWYVDLDAISQRFPSRQAS